MRNKNKEKIYSIGCFLLIIDQLIKLLVKGKLDVFDEVEIIPNFFSIFYLENKGAAFSILDGKVWFLILISIGVIFLVNYYIKKEEKFSILGIVSLGMIIGGIFGNLIDRILYKAVIDYLAFDLFGRSMPVFNFADICITVGTLCYIIDMLRGEVNACCSRRRKCKNR